MAKFNIDPIIWSLKNRGMDWELDEDGFTINHKPTGHQIWVSNGLWFYYIRHLMPPGITDPCERLADRVRFERKVKFTFWQKLRFAAAYTVWHYHYAPKPKKDQLPDGLDDRLEREFRAEPSKPTAEEQYYNTITGDTRGQNP